MIGPWNRYIKRGSKRRVLKLDRKDSDIFLAPKLSLGARVKFGSEGSIITLDRKDSDILIDFLFEDIFDRKECTCT